MDVCRLHGQRVLGVVTACRKLAEGPRELDVPHQARVHRARDDQSRTDTTTNLRPAGRLIVTRAAEGSHALRADIDAVLGARNRFGAFDGIPEFRRSMVWLLKRVGDQWKR